LPGPSSAISNSGAFLTVNVASIKPFPSVTLTVRPTKLLTQRVRNEYMYKKLSVQQQKRCWQGGTRCSGSANGGGNQSRGACVQGIFARCNDSPREFQQRRWISWREMGADMAGEAAGTRRRKAYFVEKILRCTIHASGTRFCRRPSTKLAAVVRTVFVHERQADLNDRCD